MDWNRITVRDKLETMWFFHRVLVAKLLISDTVLAGILYYLCRDSLGILPLLCVPSFSVLNFFVAGRGQKPGHIRLPLSLFVSFAYATAVTFAIGNPSHSPSDIHERAIMGGWINSAFLILFAFITACIGFATYVVWSESEMDSEVRRYRANARLR